MAYIKLDEPEPQTRRINLDVPLQEPPKPSMPREIASTVAEPFKRAAVGLVTLPYAVAKNLYSARGIDVGELAMPPEIAGEAMSKTASDIRRTALPIVGGIAGSAVGPAGTLAGATGGVFLNQIIDQLKEEGFDVTEMARPEFWRALAGQATEGSSPKTRELLTEAATISAMPPVIAAFGKTLRGAGRLVPRIIPGGSAALQQQSANIAETLPTKIRVAPSSTDLYRQYHQAGPATISTPTLAAEAARLAAKEGQIIKTWRESNIQGATGDIMDLLSQSPAGLSLEQLRLNLSRARKMSWALEDTNPEVAGAMKDLFKAGWTDIENAAGTAGPQASLLKKANRAYRREMAQEALEDWTKGTETKRGAVLIREDGLTQFNAGKVLDKIRRDEFWRGSLEPGELRQITQTLEQLGETPKLPPVRGATYGTATVIGRTALGGGGGAMVGGPMGAAIGGYLFANAPRWIANAFMTKAGRASLMGLMRASGGPYLSQDQLMTLGTTIGAINAGETPIGQESVPEAVRMSVRQFPSRTSEEIRAIARQTYELSRGNISKYVGRLMDMGIDPRTVVE